MFLDGQGIAVEHPQLGGYRLDAAPAGDVDPVRLSCDNQTNINDHPVTGAPTIAPRPARHRGHLVLPAHGPGRRHRRDPAAPAPTRPRRVGSNNPSAHAPGPFEETMTTDTPGAQATAGVTIRVGNTAPVVTMTSPVVGLTWRVGDVINFNGGATDAEDGTLPASALNWNLVLNHCRTNCHQHPLQTFTGVASGSFVAPDYEYPSYLELTLAATESGGLTSTVIRRLDPRTVTLTFQTTPGGLKLTVNAREQKASITRTVIVGWTNTVSAITPQQKGPKNYTFQLWSDGGAQTHTIVAPANATTFTARYR